VFAVVVGQFAQGTGIDPDIIDATTKSQWCLGQVKTCGVLCSGDLATNDCNTDTLKYDCTCQSNGSTPGLQYYQFTMPTFICEQIFDNCIADNTGNATGQVSCEEDEKANCGHLDPATFVAPAAPKPSIPSSSVDFDQQTTTTIFPTSSSRRAASSTSSSSSQSSRNL
ncbi:hypothetical protein DL98DRAFT_367629, partial [Cadophora sp. DSE1049]